MPLPLALAMGVGSLASGLLQNRNRRQTSTSRPTFDPAFTPLRDQLLRRITSRVGQKSQLAQGVGNAQVANVNQVFGNLAQNQKSRLASAGMLGGNVEEAGARTLDIARGGSIVDVLNNLPLVEEQMDQDNLRMGGGILGMGRGQTTAGEVEGSAAAGLGEGLDDFGSFLGAMFANKGKDPSGMAPAWAQWLQTAMRGNGHLQSMPNGVGDSFLFGGM